MGDNGFSIYTNSMNILKIFLDLDFFYSIIFGPTHGIKFKRLFVFYYIV